MMNRRDIDITSLPEDFVAKVLQFPKKGQHAKANAAFSAQLLEADRVQTRKAEIRDLITAYTNDSMQIELVLSSLRVEYRRLSEVSSGN